MAIRYNTKTSGPEERWDIFEEFCDHIAQGKDAKSFTYQDGDLKISGQTVSRWIKIEPDLYKDPYEFAMAKCFAYWEKIVIECALGRNKRCNIACLRMVMRNKFGWDKDIFSEDLDEQNLHKMRQFFSSLVPKSKNDKEQNDEERSN